MPRTRAAGLWFAVACYALLLLLVLIFILQNGQRSEVHFPGAHGHLPTGVALLLAAVFGVLTVTVPATVRIIQLRRLAVLRDIPPADVRPAEPVRPPVTIPEQDADSSGAATPHHDAS